MVPNTMVARLCEQAAERHQIKIKADSMGLEITEEELDLCGIVDGMAKSGKVDSSKEAGEGEGGGEDEEDTGKMFTKRRRRGTRERPLSKQGTQNNLGTNE